MPTPLDLVRKCLQVLDKDLPTLEKIDRYARGDHDEPYLPASADAEYRQLAERCVTNLTEFVVGTSAQAMYVDGFRRSSSLTKGESTADGVEPEWAHWQQSRLDARQSAVYRGALTFGHSFVVTEKVGGKVISRGLSAMRTAAIFDDPSVDENPLMAVHIKRYAEGDARGQAVAWDEKYVYDVAFKSLSDPKGVSLSNRRLHGAKENPVTRFAAIVDLEGRTVGVVEPLIQLQDRLNQTVFDLLVTQTFSSFKVRTATGMAPPMKTRPVYERPNGTPSDAADKGRVIGVEPVLDSQTGRPVPENVKINGRRILFAEDKDARFGTLDETPLDGFLSSIEMSFRHIAALSQTPPHHLLGQIANLSAEALQAAETALQRKVAEFQAGFGESWERVFRIAASLSGDTSIEDDYSGEVLWRDVEQRSMAQAGDALGKLKEQLEIPAEGLWARVPGVTSSEMAHWKALREEADKDAQLTDALNRASGASVPSFRVTAQQGRPADSGADASPEPAVA